MTIQSEKRTVTRTVEVDRVFSVTCDLCDETFSAAETDDKNSCGIRWTGYKMGEFAATTVSFETGTTYPDSSSSRSRSYHVCPKCFESVLEPLLRAKGAKPTETCIDW